MTLHVRDAGTWKTVNDPLVRDGSTWKPLQEGWVKDAGTWKRFFIRALTAVGISPGSWLQSFTNGESPQTKGFEANPIGGTEPYSYSWQVTNTGGGTLSIIGSTTSKTCTLQAAGSDTNCTGDLTCTVTDAASTVKAGSAGINVQFGVPQ